MYSSTELFISPLSNVAILQSTLEAIELPAWYYDVSSQLVITNHKCCDLVSLSGLTVSLTRLLTYIHPEDVAQLHSLTTESPQENTAQINRFRLRGGNKEFEWVEALMIWSFGPNGEPLGNLNIIVSEYPRHSRGIPENGSVRDSPTMSLKSSQLIIGELQHRLRNILMVVSSLAENTARTADTLDDFLSDFSDKLNTLSRSQAQICSDNQKSISFTEIASNEIMRILSEPLLISIEGPVIYIREELIPIFQLILYELATNSLKYGAAKSLRGSITLSCCHTRNAQMEAGVEFRWSEHWNLSTDDKPISHWESTDGRNVTGNGMRLLQTLINQYCKGTFDYTLDNQKLEVSWYVSKDNLLP
ncbi:MAG: HWE histidine kinase domain-containing protein [Bdellovibrionota bacterium]